MGLMTTTPPKSLRRCTKCGHEKPLSEFYKDARRSNAYRAACKKCLHQQIVAKENGDPDLKRLRGQQRNDWLRRKKQDPVYRAEANKKTSEWVKRRRRSDPDFKQRVNAAGVRYKLKYKYGLTQEQLQSMVRAQKCRCFTCDKETDLNIDHCHKSGTIRRLLCRNCNLILGLAGDNPDIIERLAAYLRDHSQAIDMRQLGDALHHEAPGHQPIPGQ
jgi:hypothetical protein